MTGARRIRGHRVPACFPVRGDVHVILYGEAPGPLGADRSGVPFWGDRSGKLVYRALALAGMAEVPVEAWSHWDGRTLARLGLRPRLDGAALSNALGFCPTRDGQQFCAPPQAELLRDKNIARVISELQQAAKRCPHTLTVIAMGRHSQKLLDKLMAAPAAPPFVLERLAHPSAQALLSTAPAKGKGLKLVDLQRRWEQTLVALLQSCKVGARPRTNNMG
jgi:hypothetical protein